MPRTVSIGCQDFEKLRLRNNFYVDKTAFIKEWWEADDEVTLITRPRRFGKTLTMSMLEKFFSVEYAGRSDFFEWMNIWSEEKYRKLQGTYPVIFISFAPVKETTFLSAQKKLFFLIAELYNRFDFLLDSGILKEAEKEYYRKVSFDMEAHIATDALKALSGFLMRYYGKKVILLLDEYDTPMQEAYVYGYWEELVTFTRSLFNASFKSNPY
ncbi:MAG: AAA family ATPase, partial [Acetatifactor sp.]|nr:AAA family ATPase [Acetatifactor sp.]